MDSALLPRNNPGSGSMAAADGAHSHTVVDSPDRRSTVDWICVAAARNVLIVDDNDRHLDILSTILRSVGNNVETCGSGAEALRRLDCRRYDVVVLDLVMPEVSGLTVAQEMRQGHLNDDTPLVICTANWRVAESQMADVQNVTAIISKPIDTASLILAVVRAPVRERPASRASA